MILRESRKPQILVSRMVDTATRIHPAESGIVSDYVNSAPQNRASATHSRHPLGGPHARDHHRDPRDHRPRRLDRHPHLMPLARVLACGHTAPLDQPCPVCGPTPAKRAESQRKRERDAWRMVYSTPRWKTLRLEILKRDHFTCQDCGGRATVAAHTEPFDPASEAAFDPRKLKASCVPCNSREASNRYHATKEAHDASQITQTSSLHGPRSSRQEDRAWVE